MTEMMVDFTFIPVLNTYNTSEKIELALQYAWNIGWNENINCLTIRVLKDFSYLSIK